MDRRRLREEADRRPVQLGAAEVGGGHLGDQLVRAWRRRWRWRRPPASPARGPARRGRRPSDAASRPSGSGSAPRAGWPRGRRRPPGRDVASQPPAASRTFTPCRSAVNPAACSRSRARVSAGESEPASSSGSACAQQHHPPRRPCVPGDRLRRPPAGRYACRTTSPTATSCSRVSVAPRSTKVRSRPAVLSPSTGHALVALPAAAGARPGPCAPDRAPACPRARCTVPSSSIGSFSSSAAVCRQGMPSREDQVGGGDRARAGLHASPSLSRKTSRLSRSYARPRSRCPADARRWSRGRERPCGPRISAAADACAGVSTARAPAHRWPEPRAPYRDLGSRDGLGLPSASPERVHVPPLDPERPRVRRKGARPQWADFVGPPRQPRPVGNRGLAVDDGGLEACMARHPAGTRQGCDGRHKIATRRARHPVAPDPTLRSRFRRNWCRQCLAARPLGP